jgi:hypothetical protein
MTNMVVWGEIIIFDCSLSKYLVNPAPEEGKLILLSLAITGEKAKRFKNIVDKYRQNKQNKNLYLLIKPANKWQNWEYIILL